MAQKFVVIVLLISVMGPYLFGGLRTEQIAVYALLIFALVAMPKHFSVDGGRKFLVPWCLYILIAVIATTVDYPYLTGYEFGNWLAGLDSLMIPVGIMILIWMTVDQAAAKSLLLLACKAVSIMLALNGLLTVISTTIDLQPVLSRFWTQDPDGVAVADLAMTVGRYSGILNQPAEAGALYGLAGIGAVYAYKHRPVFLALLLSFICLGGLMAVSKVFVLCGFPIVLGYWLWSQKGVRRLASLGLACISVALTSLLGVWGSWGGTSYLLNLLNPDADWVRFFSAGRYGGSSTLESLSTTVLSISPVFGIGIRGISEAYDSMVTEALVFAGLIGVAIAFVIIAGVFSVALKMRDKELRIFALLFAVIILAGSLGFSPLTANRVSAVFWVFLSLLVVIGRSRLVSGLD